jgi:UDPglucose 6-dehydrogenase
MRISIVGLGRVGLAAAVCFAKKGHQVIGIDTDEGRVAEIQNAVSPFFEPELDVNLKEVVRTGRFSATGDVSLNAESDLTFVTVGTPNAREGIIDLSQVKNAATMIGKSLSNTDRSQLVVLKSTVIPGTARNIVKPILETQSGKALGEHIHLCSNPEFLRQGSALHDTFFPDRIIIGGDDQDGLDGLARFYKSLHGRKTPAIIRTTCENAELIKYANNAFLATKLAFINSIADMAESILHTDIKVVEAGIGLDVRIGSQYLNAGLGWGGACLPKDVRALLEFSKSLGGSSRLIESVVEFNEKRWERLIHMAKSELGSLEGKKIAVLGLAFKPNTDDVQGAASIQIIRKLLAGGASVVACDPAAVENTEAIFRDKIAYTNNPIECLDQAECCIVVTGWETFKEITPHTFVERMRRPIVIDGRRIYDAQQFLNAGIKYSAIGLGPRASQGSTSLNDLLSRIR